MMAVVLMILIKFTISASASNYYYRVPARFYEEFLGIPFAAPPVGDLRRQKPQLVEPWEGVLNATASSIHCTQFLAPTYAVLGMGDVSGEDCLYLNIWVSRGVSAHQ